MSNTDSFIDEVTEEVRRDRFYKLLKRYGWIAVAAVVLLVGATAWNEWNKAQQRQAAQALGDQVLNALESDDRTDRTERAAALAAIDAPEGGARGILGLLAASEAGTEAPEEAATQLLALADDPNVPQVYRQIAVLKAMALPGNGLTIEDRRSRLDGLLPGGGVVRLLAEEQLAYLDIEAGNVDAALDRLRQIGESAEATIGLRQRAAQMVVALGGELTQAPVPSETGQDDGN